MRIGARPDDSDQGYLVIRMMLKIVRNAAVELDQEM